MKKISKKNFTNTIFEPLLEIPDLPDTLYVLGDYTNIQDKKLITIIGSRICSGYAKKATQDLIKGLAGYPVCIVSGLALGIDGVAHTQAIESGIQTIAFPGSGLNKKNLYPATHIPLAKNIITSNGLLVSEYEPDTRGAKWTFPKRNRLMAGIADLIIIIIEAREKSGTLITARLGLDYNKTIAVVPHNIDNQYAIGSNKLLRDGAYPLLEVTDILHLVGIKPVETQEITIELTTVEKSLYDLLKQPVSKNDLYIQLGINYTTFIETFSMMEIKGIIKEQYGLVQKC